MASTMGVHPGHLDARCQAFSFVSPHKIGFLGELRERREEEDGAIQTDRVEQDNARMEMENKHEQYVRDLKIVTDEVSPYDYL